MHISEAIKLNDYVIRLKQLRDAYEASSPSVPRIRACLKQEMDHAGQRIAQILRANPP